MQQFKVLTYTILVFAMTVSLGKKLDDIERMLDFPNQYIDLAVQFVDYTKCQTGKPVPTGRVSEVHGGVYDVLCGVWTDRNPTDIVQLSTWGVQFDYIQYNGIISVYSAGRGCGKSYSAALRFIRKILPINPRDGDDPSDVEEILVLSDNYTPTKAIFKYVRKLLPERFIADYRWSDKNEGKYIVFANGPVMTPISGVTESKARSKSSSDGHVDECQLVKSDRYDAFVGSIREGENPSISMTGTMSDRMDDILTQFENEFGADEVGIFYGDPEDSPYLSKRAHRLRTIGMSARAYRIEIKNDRTLVQQDKLDERPLLFPSVSKKHLVNRALMNWNDTTKRFTARRFGKAWEYILCYDPNRSDPNYAVIGKIYDNIHLVAIDMILELGHCGKLAQTCTDRGYTTKNTLVLDDASAVSRQTYNKYSSHSPRELFKKAGYTVWNESRPTNPSRTDSVEHLNSLFDPVSGGMPLVLIDIELDTADHTQIKNRTYPGLFNDLCTVKWADANRDTFYKQGTRDDTHGADCLRLMAWYVLPHRKHVKPTIRRVEFNVG